MHITNSIFLFWFLRRAWWLRAATPFLGCFSATLVRVVTIWSLTLVDPLGDPTLEHRGRTNGNERCYSVVVVVDTGSTLLASTELIQVVLV